jgi:hypothetical protein
VRFGTDAVSLQLRKARKVGVAIKSQQQPPKLLESGWSIRRKLP